MKEQIYLMCFLLALVGCASVQQRRNHALQIAQTGGLTPHLLQAPPFAIRAYVKAEQPGAPLVIYFEGDGFAWATSSRPSDDPTPKNPVALGLAALDPAPNVAYIARPCQYVPQEENSACTRAYWTNKRFAKEVIDSMVHSVSLVMKMSSSTKVYFVGYSGGAGIAALVAARRTDVLSLRTVAGNLDNKVFTDYHNVSSMPESLDPADVAERLKDLPQWHGLGGDDPIVRPLIAQSFAKKAAGSKCIWIEIIPGLTHSEGWEKIWRDIISRPLACRN